ncbi:hypothetical protein N9Z83_02480 [Akkermansiaceae bacterium]|nr:hypothetical protein [Akkermansiaceae bacterium]
MKWFSRLLSVTAIAITDSHVTCKKGTITPQLTNDLRSFFSGLDHTNAEIWIDGAGKVSFSSEIPVRYHQRLRNILIGVHRSS